MKKIVLTLATAVVATFSNAQIVVDSADFASVGDVIYTAQDTQVTGITVPAGSSTAQSWDYSALTTHVLDSAEFLNPAATPGASEFPGADIALLQDGQYVYLEKTDAHLDIIGLYGDITGQGIVLPIKPLPAQRNMVFPSTLGTTFINSSVIDSTVEDTYTGIFDSLRLRRLTDISSEIDAFGSLTTPSATYSGVLRQKLITTNTDTIWGYNQLLGMWTQVTTLVTTEYAYRFIANGKDFYVLELQAFNNGQVFSARYQIDGKPIGSPAITDVACAGGTEGSISQTVFGGAPPYTYQWSTGATTKDISGLSAGSYTVTIYDQSDSSVATHTVNEPAPIIVTESTNDEVFGADGSITLSVSGGTSPYSYTWSSGETTRDIAGLVAGIYTVTVTDANNCDTNFTYTVGNNTSAGLVAQETGIRIFPNPASDRVEVQTTSAGLSVWLYNLAGKQVVFRKDSGSSITVALDELPVGIYFIEAQSDVATYRDKLIIAR